ncbi:MAG TPA: 30S ribosomal protein S6 [Candidatus Methanoperedens sp.]|nr:30S ribosomal protein S6 [Candidatus Methanoperedens sp.]
MKDSNYKYEVIVVLNPKAESKDKEKTIKLIEDYLTEMNFSVDNRDNLGNKELAYKVKGSSKGDFWVFTIGGDKPIKSKEFNLFLNRDLQVIRYLILKI